MGGNHQASYAVAASAHSAGYGTCGKWTLATRTTPRVDFGFLHIFCSLVGFDENSLHDILSPPVAGGLQSVPFLSIRLKD